MRLAYLVTQYPAVSHTFIRRELRELERRHHDVLRLAIRRSRAPLVDPQDQEEARRTIVCLGQSWWRLGAAALRMLASRPLAAFGALVLALAMGRRSERGLLRHLAYFVEACFLAGLLRRERTQHVHVHFGTNSTSVARLIRRLGGPTYSFTVHGPDEFDAPLGIALPGKIADAAFVVAISDFGAAQLRRWARVCDWPKIHVVHCAVGDDFLPPILPVDARADTFVCVGRLAPQKGPFVLIDALQQLARAGEPARIIFAGDGELRAELEAYARAAGVEDRVRITGWVDGATIRELLSVSRGLVLPSFAEGLPVVIMEAFALGRPVISTYVAGIPELVRPGENGWLVPAGNAEALADALRAAYHTPADELSQMGRRGRAAVEERHHLRTEVDKLEALLKGQLAADEAPLPATAQPGPVLES